MITKVYYSSFWLVTNAEQQELQQEGNYSVDLGITI